MAIINYKPTTNARRNMFHHGLQRPEQVWPGEEPCWLRRIKLPAATATAESPSATEAAANRKKYRIIDFKRQKNDMAATGS